MRPLRKVQQITEEHCGPAVLEMLLSSLGIHTDQYSITLAAGVERSIHEHGTRVDQLAQACTRVAPLTTFWYKRNATLDDIRYILHRGYGVGVQWQGLFYENEDEEEEDGDYGHYSVIAHLDEQRQVFVIVDPYKDFVHRDRIFPLHKFLPRWWDTNEITDSVTHKREIVEDQRMLFFVTPIWEFFPPERGFIAAER
jgi:ABC-type bacteriocin/lantibiotic exporter with double-glycine peptidase domain